MLIKGANCENVTLVTSSQVCHFDPSGTGSPLVIPLISRDRHNKASKAGRKPEVPGPERGEGRRQSPQLQTLVLDYIGLLASIPMLGDKQPSQPLRRHPRLSSSWEMPMRTSPPREEVHCSALRPLVECFQSAAPLLFGKEFEKAAKGPAVHSLQSKGIENIVDTLAKQSLPLGGGQFVMGPGRVRGAPRRGPCTSNACSSWRPSWQ